jgi:hypothetical protein
LQTQLASQLTSGWPAQTELADRHTDGRIDSRLDTQSQLELEEDWGPNDLLHIDERMPRRTKTTTTTTTSITATMAAKKRMRKRRQHLDTAQTVINYEQGCFWVNLRPVRYVGIKVKRVRQGVSRLRIICSNGLQ